MSDSTSGLRRKIDSAADLQSVVRTMKAMAASNIGQYENAVHALDGYYRNVQLGLAACFRQEQARAAPASAPAGLVYAVVFGSDQGLVGQFNETMADFVGATLGRQHAGKVLWAVGQRMQSRLTEAGLAPEQSFVLPNSIDAITALVGQILTEIEARRASGRVAQVLLFHQRPSAAQLATPVAQTLLPLDEAWRGELAAMPWPTKKLPELVGGLAQTLPAFVREYLFVSLFRTCAESLASENASRLAAMQRAEKNIDELLEELNQNFHRLRQSGIDEELFDVISGFEALNSAK